MEALKKIDFRLGTIVLVKLNAKAKNPSFIVDIDFGNAIGKKTTSAQLPANYTEQQLLASKQVVCIVNFPVKRIAGFKSEVLVVGFPDENSKVILLNTRNINFPNGTQIQFLSSSQNDSSINPSAVLPETTYEVFESANITVGTIKQVDKQENGNQSTLTVDFGESVGSKSLVVANLSSDVSYEVGSQLPVVIDQQTNELIPLGISNDNDGQSVVLLGVDRPVPNGGKLF